MKQQLIYITAGQGPVECTWVAAKVWGKFLKAAKGVGCRYTILQQQAGSENGTLSAACCLIEHDVSQRLDTFLQDWLGTIQWIGKSAYRKFHKRSNWYVALFAQDIPVQQQFNERDVQFKTCKSSGPGGQHVNKTNSAVQAVHIPTQTQVMVSDSRSQHQNRKIAMERLRQKIADKQEQVLSQLNTNTWLLNYRVERGNPIQVFEGEDFKPKPARKKYDRKALKQNWSLDY